MKICIPTVDEAGRASRISDHFGSARWLTLVDSVTGEARSVANRDRGHVPGSCDAADSLSGLGAEAVICMGIGRRALGSLTRAGIQVFVTESGTVGEAVAEYEMDILAPLVDEDACRGGRRFGVHHRHGT